MGADTPGPVPGKVSKASTATVVNFLARSQLWRSGAWNGRQTELADAILSAEWESAELGVGNEFTTGFMLEALHSLKACGAEWGEEGQQRVEREARRMNASPINRKRDRLRHF